MDAKSSTIAAFLSENKQYVAPVYQRNYAWLAQNQCQALWNDLLSLTSNSKSKHFLGSVVIIKLDDSLGRNFVIDGQQRLTTIQLILVAIRDYVRECQESDKKGQTAWSESGDDFVESIHELLFNNSDECKLELNGDDSKVFSKLVRGLSHNTLTAIDKSTNVFLNYQYFLERLRHGLADDADHNGVSFAELSNLYRWLTKGFEIACIVLESRDNPQRVFESLNSTGLDLQASDLIRNYVLMSSDGNEAQQKELYDKYWHPFEQLFPPNDSTPLTNFFLTLVVLKQLASGIKDDALAKPNELYITFKRFYCNDSEQGALVYARELLQYGICYARIMGWQQEEDRTLAKIFADIKWLEGSASNAFYAVVLYLYYCYQTKREGFGRNEFIQACQYIVSCMVRRAVCSRKSQDSRKLRGMLFADLAEPNNLSEQLNINFSTALDDDAFPKDAEFEYSIKTIDLYHTNLTLRLCRFVLTRLAEMNRTNTKALENMTIEHILPQNKNLNEAWQKELGSDWQSLQELWLHRLGNLTLTFENSELGDRPFVEKLGFYRKSAITFINDYVVKCEHWTPEQMEERGKLLAERSLVLWPMPQTVEHSKIKSKVTSRKRTSRTLADYCGTSQTLLETLKEINQQIQGSWSDLKGFKCLMKQELIEYCAYSQTLAIIKPDSANGVAKLWLHCYYNELPDEVQHEVSLSSDWVSWKGDEVSIDLDSTAEKPTLLACYYMLSKALDSIKHQFNAELI